MIGAGRRVPVRTTIGAGLIVWGLFLFVFGATGHMLVGRQDTFVGVRETSEPGPMQRPSRSEMLAGAVLAAAGALVCYKTEPR